MNDETKVLVWATCKLLGEVRVVKNENNSADRFWDF